MKLREGMPDVGTLTAAGMLLGIIGGWGVLYLTRIETSVMVDYLDLRLEEVERVVNVTPSQEWRWEERRRRRARETERDATEAEILRLSAARRAYLRNEATQEDLHLLRKAGDLQTPEEGAEDKPE